MEVTISSNGSAPVWCFHQQATFINPTTIIITNVLSFMEILYPSAWPHFFTASLINKDKHLLKKDLYKNIIIDALKFAVINKRINLFGFVIMSNHIHLVWQQIPPHTRESIQHGFMKFTAQQIKFHLLKNDPDLLSAFKVQKKDRAYQFWKRNPLSIELFTPIVFNQKMNYVHCNPVKAGICEYPENYKYSSAAFYEKGIDEFGLFPDYEKQQKIIGF